MTEATTVAAGTLTLRALGAAGTVTGSKFLLSAPGCEGLLIDYGLFQGNRELDQRNFEPPDAGAVAAAGLILTHAHLDHAGALPVLVKAGWRGTPYATEATA